MEIIYHFRTQKVLYVAFLKYITMFKDVAVIVFSLVLLVLVLEHT